MPSTDPTRDRLRHDDGQSVGRSLRDLCVISVNPPPPSEGSKRETQVRKRVEPRQEAPRNLRSPYREEGRANLLRVRSL